MIQSRLLEKEMLSRRFRSFLLRYLSRVWFQFHGKLLLFSITELISHRYEHEPRLGPLIGKLTDLYFQKVLTGKLFIGKEYKYSREPKTEGGFQQVSWSKKPSISTSFQWGVFIRTKALAKFTINFQLKIYLKNLLY